MGITAEFRRCGALGLLVFGIMTGAVEAGTDWSTYQGNAAHTGYVSGSYNFNNPKLLWHTVVAPNSLTGLAVGDNTVFITNQAPFSNNTSFNALDQTTGSVLWSKAFGTSNDTTSAPAYYNGAVYFQTDGNSSVAGNFLNAYNARTGATLFNAPYQAQWETYLNPTPYGGNIYTGGGYYGGMYSFNATTGQQNWFGTVPQYDGWTPAVDGKYAYAYTGSGDTTPIKGVFTMINLATGTTAATVVDPVYNWNGYTMNSAVVLGTNNDAFTINGGRLVSWDTTLDATHTPHIAWSLTDQYSGQPTLANGKLYVIDNGGIAVLDEKTGNLLWTWSTSSGSILGPMIVTDNLLFAQTSTETFAIDLFTHQVDWSYNASGSLAFADSSLYIAGSDGTVYAIGAASVPEPASMVLLGIGVAGLVVMRRLSR
jgi:hypothetical protein